MISSELDVPNRPDTLAAYRAAVERVIEAMRGRLGEELSLEEMAEIARLSPYHFLRVFRSLTGLPPGQFLSALRLDEAKRLLLTTDRSVTEICFDVGYGSLGTFTSRFTQLVGLSPTRFRQLGTAGLPNLEELPERLFPAVAGAVGCDVSGRLEAAPGGLIFLGLFQHAIPQGRPLGCGLATGPGLYHVPAPGDGRYFLFSVGMGLCLEAGDLLSQRAIRQVGRAGPVLVRDGKVRGRTILRLRPPDPLDPPLLLTLPLLIAERLRSLEQRFAADLDRVQIGNLEEAPRLPPPVAS